MRNDTRLLFNAYLARQAELNGVTNATAKFSVAPTVEQKLEDRIRESADFLKLINVVPVDQQSGEKLGLGISQPAAGRTDTSQNDRQPRNLVALDSRDYTAIQTNFDTAIKYSQLDAWAKFPDFQVRVRNQTTQQIARDRLMIGWNGQTAAANTDLLANPLLQDVNIGWLKHIRTDAPARVMDGVKIGNAAGADYKTFDAAVFDAVNELLDQWHAEASDLVVIVGRQLLNDKYLGLLNSADAPTEKVALQTLMLSRTIGGKQAISVPYFPPRSILITSPDNLSIYWQNGTRRRMIQDNPKRDRIEDFQSVNEAYVVEDLGKAALIDGIELPSTEQDGWA
ncbi:phage major capsid protein, P2 family (plasmid) [Azospirillum melinis]|uniref:phage major capsid protein, P2 family n=1 Tax=Azospirillum melinis TaxID=328839 RepID=UPI0037576092